MMVPPLALLLALLHPCHGEGGTGDWDYHSQYRLPVPRAQDQVPHAQVPHGQDLVPHVQDQVPLAQDRMDPGSGIDAALLRQVLEDPVLLQAVDPNVLQMVLVQAATANLLTIPHKLSPTTTTSRPTTPSTPPPRPAPPPLNPQPLLPPQSLSVSSSVVAQLPHSLEELQVDLPNLDPVEAGGGGRPPRRSPPAPATQLVTRPQLDTASLAQALRDHPDIAAELATRLQREPGLAADLGLVAPVPATTTRPPPACPRHSPGGPCGPGLAYSPLSRACEFPDTLMEAGCNPEAITGFGACPQDPRDPHLTQAQVATWPTPRFSLTPALASLHSLSPSLAPSYYIICIPTRYGKLFPRLTSCPSGQPFDPSHGCPAPPPPPPQPLAPPVYGSPEPQITHIGAPLPPGSPKFSGFPSIISQDSLHGPAIEIEEQPA